MSVNFNNADKTLVLAGKMKLRKVINEIFRFNKVRLSQLDYIFCSDDYLLNINKEFLKHDYYTDVITFDLTVDQNATGEVYISIDRVKDNALNLNLSFKQELNRVMFHGALHLCGFKDKNRKQKTTMRNAEDFWLNYFECST